MFIRFSVKLYRIIPTMPFEYQLTIFGSFWIGCLKTEHVAFRSHSNGRAKNRRRILGSSHRRWVLRCKEIEALHGVCFRITAYLFTFVHGVLHGFLRMFHI